jgi:hypothetical protein
MFADEIARATVVVFGRIRGQLRSIAGVQHTRRDGWTRVRASREYRHERII